MSYCTVAHDIRGGEEVLLHRADPSPREAKRAARSPPLAHVFDGRGRIIHSSLAPGAPEV